MSKTSNQAEALPSADNSLLDTLKRGGESIKNVLTATDSVRGKISAYEPVMLDKRAVEYHDQYNLSPLRVMQNGVIQGRFSETFHNKWLSAIDNAPPVAPKSNTPEGVRDHVGKSYTNWLDRYNAEISMGRQSKNLILPTKEKLKNDPHLARILATFATQDRVEYENAQPGAGGSKEIPYTPVKESVWAQKPKPVESTPSTLATVASGVGKAASAVGSFAQRAGSAVVNGFRSLFGRGRKKPSSQQPLGQADQWQTVS